MNETFNDLLAALEPVVEAFSRLGVAYYVGGSAVSSNYGVARSTLDVDLVADLRAEHVVPLVDALKSDYYIERRTVADAVARKTCFNAIHLPTSFKVDVFTLKGRPYDRAALQRIHADSLDDAEPAKKFFQASPEDIILAKLEWYRLGDEVSDRQWGDVIGVLKVQRHVLDRAYLEKWAVELGVADLLWKAWREVES
jgi:hypothetical protein